MIGIIILPWLGVLIYLIARGGKMHERQIETSPGSRTGLPTVRPGNRSQRPAPTRADQLAKLADLRDKGVITQAEFETEKAKVLTS